MNCSIVLQVSYILFVLFEPKKQFRLQAEIQQRVRHATQQFYQVNKIISQIVQNNTIFLPNSQQRYIIFNYHNYIQYMQTNKRPQSLNQLIHLDTKDFIQQLRNQYKPHFNNYSRTVYNKLLNCYKTHITAQALQTLDSNAMLSYYSCYKGVLRQSKSVNKKLQEQGLNNQKKLKHCLEIKSNFSKSNAEFEVHHDECLQKYRTKYQDLFNSIFKQFTPNLDKAA